MRWTREITGHLMLPMENPGRPKPSLDHCLVPLVSVRPHNLKQTPAHMAYLLQVRPDVADGHSRYCPPSHIVVMIHVNASITPWQHNYY